MANGKRKLTDSELEAFLAENRFGVLAFAGEDPYAIPLGYFYRKGDLIVGFGPGSRKNDYLKNSPKVCFNIWQWGEQSTVPSLREQRYNSVTIEGKLEEITRTDWAYYELPIPPDGIDVVGYKLKRYAVGSTSANKVT